jgi:hypothetical protein
MLRVRGSTFSEKCSKRNESRNEASSRENSGTSDFPCSLAGAVTNAFVNRTPSWAIRSMLGVRLNGWPAAPRSSQRTSSAKMKTMSGRFVTSAAAAHR